MLRCANPKVFQRCSPCSGKTWAQVMALANEAQAARGNKGGKGSVGKTAELLSKAAAAYRTLYTSVRELLGNNTGSTCFAHFTTSQCVQGHLLADSFQGLHLS